MSWPDSGEREMDALKLLYITNNPSVALIAEKYGVDRIWIDLETEGKEERQKGRDTVKSRHSINDIKTIKPLLSTSEMLVRIHPWSERSGEEIEAVVDAGADIIMLPMWRTAEEAQAFVQAVGGRCRTLLLLETIAAEKSLEEALTIPGVDEFFIGTNDLHIEYGLTHLLQLLSNGKVEEICKKIKPSGIPFGFSGIGMPGLNFVPSPEEIINEHFRLGSSSLILSRSFCNYEKIGNLDEIEKRFSIGVKAIRNQEKLASHFTQSDFLRNKEVVCRGVDIMLRQMRDKR